MTTFLKVEGRKIMIHEGNDLAVNILDGGNGGPGSELYIWEHEETGTVYVSTDPPSHRFRALAKLNGSLLFRGKDISSLRWPALVLTRTGGHGMTVTQELHQRHGITMQFKHGDRVTVPCRSGRREGIVTDETSNVVWVLRDDQPTASPYIKRDVEVAK